MFCLYDNIHTNRTLYNTNRKENTVIIEKSIDATVAEMIDILKNLPEERKAYLNGYAAGMAAEKHLSTTDDTRSA